MTYEKSGKKVNKDTAKNAKDYELKGIDTSQILWHIVKRHKFGLVSTYAIIMTVMYIFPAAPAVIADLF